MEDFLQRLRQINGDRWKAWSQGTGEDPLYQANEFGGEAGEVLNVVKKLVREQRGWRGSRATKEQLSDEIADCIICLDSLARSYDIDIETAVTKKFNETSEKNGFPHRIDDRVDGDDAVSTGVNFFDMEDRIHSSWNIIDDIRVVYENVANADHLDTDEISNLLLGLVSIYDLKFNNLFNLYSDLLSKRRA